MTGGHRTLLDVLMDGLGAEDWMTDAVCVGQDPELFFSDQPERLSQAREICGGCPVSPQCAEYGRGASDGIWAGVDHTQRGKRVRKRKRAKANHHERALPAEKEDR